MFLKCNRDWSKVLLFVAGSIIWQCGGVKVRFVSVLVEGGDRVLIWVRVRFTSHL